ncbi:acetyl-CoA synthetase-like protein [Bimuria novae-zelandiae CBS 107.79]|uniref:Acetyl-CoA synthetase-like protein n=1 Tax=Bimuria novae-zelandiae CBS 107.79 TaxID=1447943 RepID=A0A6A5UY88_9PLEO|nr:acetyl-CoA synthetase-like protein [Bimuria novae-zelandiae CBS 107.79]
MEALPMHSTTTVLDLLERNARVTPLRTFCLQLEESAGKLQCLTIKYETLIQMVCNCQIWLKSHLPTFSTDISVAMLLDSDVGLIVHLFAAIGLGIPTFLLSNRLSPYRLRNLLLSRAPLVLLASKSCMPLAKEALELFGTNMQVRLQCSLQYQELLVPLREKTEKLHHGPPAHKAFALHTYGEGPPRFFVLPHRYLMTLADSAASGHGMMLSTFPLQHCCGLLAPMLSLTLPGVSFVATPTSWIPCADSVVQILRQFKVKSLITSPRILEHATKVPGGTSHLRKLDYVAYTSDVLLYEVGQQLAAAGVKLINVFSTAELGIISSLTYSPNRDWRFFRLRKDVLCNTIFSSDSECKLEIRPSGCNGYTRLDGTFIRNTTTSTDFRLMERSDKVVSLAQGILVRPWVIEDALNEHVNVCKALVYVLDPRVVVVIEPTTDMTELQRSQLEPDILSLIEDAFEYGQMHDLEKEVELEIIFCDFPRTVDEAALRDGIYKEIKRDGSMNST